MLRISDARIDGFIAEDVPYVDLTCAVLGIGDEPGEMDYFTREDCVLAGTEVVRRIMGKLGCEVVAAEPSGTRVAAGGTFMTVRGASADLHAAWKVCLNVFDHCSAVATKTRAMVDAAHGANPRCEVLTTRKSQPGAKDLLTSAVMAGGAFPHRLGLSETALVFDHHLTFFGGFEAFVEQ
ncbi:MAG: ModD protein, partial [Gordonibacter urolithinfaciens]